MCPPPPSQRWEMSLSVFELYLRRISKLYSDRLSKKIAGEMWYYLTCFCIMQPYRNWSWKRCKRKWIEPQQTSRDNFFFKFFKLDVLDFDDDDDETRALNISIVCRVSLAVSFLFLFSLNNYSCRPYVHTTRARFPVLNYSLFFSKMGNRML